MSLPIKLKIVPAPGRGIEHNLVNGDDQLIDQVHRENVELFKEMVNSYNSTPRWHRYDNDHHLYIDGVSHARILDMGENKEFRYKVVLRDGTTAYRRSLDKAKELALRLLEQNDDL